MKKINVLVPFNLLSVDGVMTPFDTGIQTVEDEVADHWYTKAHSEEVAETETPAAETPAAEPATETPEPATEAVDPATDDASAAPATTKSKKAS